MSDIDKYLEPISPEKSCGENLAYDPAFLDLEVQAKGKAETQFSEAEEPNWKEVRKSAESLLGRTKHLQVGMLYTLALLQTDGLTGFRDGLSLLSGWISRYWDALYPQLDPEDNNDPTERVNILQGLSVKAFGDPFRLIDRLRDAPLGESNNLGRVTLNSAATSDPAQVAAALRDTPNEKLQSRSEAIGQSLTLLAQMAATLGPQITAGSAPNFEELERALKEMQHCLAPYVSAPAGAEPPEESAATAGAEGAGKGGFTGTVRSREEVLAALQAVADYYRRCEPSSPVPFLLDRAQRLVNMDFVQILTDLTPEALEKLKVIIGSSEGSEPKSA